jgi:NAD+ kinase
VSRRRKIQRVGVVAKARSSEAVTAAFELVEWLRRRELFVAVDATTRRSQDATAETSPDERLAPRGPAFSPEEEFDLVVVLGGDGTLLSVARHFTTGVPILGVNLGNLGFLTEIGRAELYPAMVQVLAGKFESERRMLFDVEVQQRSAGGEPRRFRVLNDAVVTKSALARIIELTLEVDGNLIARYRSDGLIVSTPTGSTAYNLSAGGPVVNPLLPVAVLTPICPHALSLRPIVVPATSRIQVILETDREEVFVTLDGQEGTPLRAGDAVRVTQSEASVRLVRLGDHGFYSNLRRKLRWGGLAPGEEGGPT